MALIVPRVSIIAPPEEWDALTLWASTVFLEASGETFEGMCAVSWVIRHRMDRGKLSVHEIVLQPFQFSCWNPPRNRSEARLISAEGTSWENAWKASSGALWRLLPDPTDGADHYLNEALTKKIRGGTLPLWFDPEKVTAKIGAHTFLRL